MTTPSINLFKRAEIVISPSMHPYIHPSIDSSIHPSVCTSTRLYPFLPPHLSMHLLIRENTCPFIWHLQRPSNYLSWPNLYLFIHSIIHPPIHPSILPLIQHKGKNSNCRAVFFLALPAPCLAVYSVFHYALTFHFIIQSLLAPYAFTLASPSKNLSVLHYLLTQCLHLPPSLRIYTGFIKIFSSSASTSAAARLNPFILGEAS